MPNSAIKLIRQVAFSSGHRYWFGQLSSEENQALFPGFASPYSHGHNYILDVETQGQIDPRTGMVVNIKAIDAILQQLVVQPFHLKSLNDEVAYFESAAPCIENLMHYIAEQLQRPGVLPDSCKLSRLRLEEMPTLFGEWTPNMTTITRVYEFSASHRLHVPSLSDEENLDLFGKCNHANGHGHNYLLEVTVSGEPHPKTGMIVSIDELDQAVNRLVVSRYDHRHLNMDIAELDGKPTTSEVVATEIFGQLDGQVPGTLERIRLHETPRNIFEVNR